MYGRPGLADVVTVARRLEGLLHLPVAVGYRMKWRLLLCGPWWWVPVIVLLSIRGIWRAQWALLEGCWFRRWQRLLVRRWRGGGRRCACRRIR